MARIATQAPKRGPGILWRDTSLAETCRACLLVVAGWRATLLDLLLLATLSLPAILPLAAPGYLHGSDYSDPPWRAMLLDEALQEGIFFPRWAPDAFHQFGYPTFNFAGPLSNYPVLLAASLAATDFVGAAKMAFSANLLLAAVGAYLLARRLIQHRGASLLAGTLYLYAPFTLSEVYVRSSLGGSAGLAILPFALASFLGLCRRPNSTASGVVATLLAATILLHNITGVVATGTFCFLVALHYLAHRNRRVLVATVLALLLGLGASSFYWVPAIAEARLTHTESLYNGLTDFHFHLANPLGDIDSTLTWRFGYEPYRQTREGPIDLHPSYPYGSPPYKLSLFQGVLFLLSGAALVRGRSRPGYMASLFALALLFLFFTTTWSTSIWEAIPPFIQFPWRLMGPFGLCLAVVGSWAIRALARGRIRWPMLLVGAAAVISSLWMLPTTLVPFEAGTGITRDSYLQYEERNRYGTHAAGQFLPLSVQWDRDTVGLDDLASLYDLRYPPEGWVAGTASISLSSKAVVTAARKGQQWMQARVYAEEPTKVLFHTIYFPGWTAYVDGNRASIEPSPWEEFPDGPRGKPAGAALGVIQVPIPEGTHEVTLRFEDTPIHRGSSLLGALGLAGIGATFLSRLWKQRGERGNRWAVGAMVLLVVLGTVLGYATYRRVSQTILPPWIENRVVRDLRSEVSRGELQVTVPSGAKPSDYINTRSFTIGRDNRPVLFMHPPASASARVWVPEEARLNFAMALDPEVWDKPGGGVQFQIELRDEDSWRILFSDYVNPKADPTQRRWIESSVDLSPFAHREVELVLRTLPGASTDFAWAGWAEPRVMIP